MADDGPPLSFGSFLKKGPPPVPKAPPEEKKDENKDEVKDEKKLEENKQEEPVQPIYNTTEMIVQ